MQAVIYADILKSSRNISTGLKSGLWTGPLQHLYFFSFPFWFVAVFGVIVLLYGPIWAKK